MKMSQKAFDLIVEEETGGEAYYNKTEASTDWPGGASGVTIGIGYDCGYATQDQIRQDWGNALPKAMVDALCLAAGIHGTPASSHAATLKEDVKVPWQVALDVFRATDVPRWEAIVEGALRNTNSLSGDSFGALTSLAFNRGASFGLSGDRYREMRAIAAHMAEKRFDAIPAEFRSMKRLWPSTKDLRDRREHEAVLFEQGLKMTSHIDTAPGDVAAPSDRKPGDVTPWLTTMRSLIGTNAANDNAKIVGWAKAIGDKYPDMAEYDKAYTSDAIAWCGLTMGYVMAMNGIRPVYGATDVDKFLYALAWRKFGDAVSGTPQPGDVLVFDFGGGDHHVTMLDHINGLSYVCIGGNQSHQVKFSTYNKSQCIAVRRVAKPIGNTGIVPPTLPHIDTNVGKKTLWGRLLEAIRNVF